VLVVGERDVGLFTPDGQVVRGITVAALNGELPVSSTLGSRENPVAKHPPATISRISDDMPVVAERQVAGNKDDNEMGGAERERTRDLEYVGHAMRTGGGDLSPIDDLL
jgi:hypothetical protein